MSELGRSASDRPSEARDSPQQSYGRNYALQPMTPREFELQNKVNSGELRWRGDQWVESERYDWVQRDDKDRAERKQAETHPPARAGDLPEAHDAEPVTRPPEDSPAQPFAWDGIDAADRPPLNDLRLAADRAEHILHGDRTGGGHLSGTGQPGKTEFPASWDSAAIVEAVTAVASSPDTVRKQWNDRWKACGTYDKVAVTVIIDPDAAIRTAWPDEGGPGVVRNPEARPR